MPCKSYSSRLCASAQGSGLRLSQKLFLRVTWEGWGCSRVHILQKASCHSFGLKMVT